MIIPIRHVKCSRLAIQHAFMQTGLTFAPRYNSALECWEYDAPIKEPKQPVSAKQASVLTPDECCALGMLCAEFAYSDHLWHKLSVFFSLLPHQSRFHARTYLNTTVLAEHFYSWTIRNTQKN